MELNALFTDHAVFQANKPIRVFGTGRGEVTVSFLGDTVTVQSVDETWLVELPPRDYGGPYTMDIIMEGTTVTLQDIYVGDVYLMAGQSNMQFKLEEDLEGAEHMTDDPLQRLFVVDRMESGDSFCSADGWNPLTKENAAYWTALGYYIARIRRREGVAVGLIGCYQGASVIETWIPENAVTDPALLIPEDQKHGDHDVRNYPWNGAGQLYHFCFEKIAPYSLSRVVWYQGESDSTVAEAAVYDRLLAVMIRRWRSDLLDNELPFVIVQIADYNDRQDAGWRGIQEAQRRAVNIIPYCRLVVSRDVCSTEQIHPPCKKALSERIAQLL